MLEAKNLDKEISVKKIDNETLNIKIFNNDVLMAIVGEFNKNLKQIEKALRIKVLQNGTEFELKGKKEDVGIGVSALFSLKEKLETNSIITPDVVHLSLHSAKFEDKENH